MTTHRRALMLAASALDFELSSAEAAELHGHLRDCLACRQSERSFADQATALRTRPRALVPADLRGAVLAERAPTFPIATGMTRVMLVAGLLIAALLSTVAIGSALVHRPVVPDLPGLPDLAPIGRQTDISVSAGATANEHNCVVIAESNCATDVIVADGSVWTTATDAVVRVDPASNLVIASIPLPNAYPQRLAAADDGIWVVAQNPGRLLRIDPATNAVTATVEVGGIPGGMAIDGRGIWVTDLTAHQLLHVDPASASVTSRIDLDIAPWSVASTGDAIWVVDRYAHQAMLQIDPVTETIARAIEIPGAGSVSGWDYGAGVAVIDGRVLILGKVQISWFDPADRTFENYVGPTNPHAVMGGDALWVVGGDRRMLQRWDPATNTELVEQRLGIDTTADAVTWEHPVAYGFGAVWIRDYVNGRLIRIDPDPASATPSR